MQLRSSIMNILVAVVFAAIFGPTGCSDRSTSGSPPETARPPCRPPRRPVGLHPRRRKLRRPHRPKTSKPQPGRRRRPRRRPKRAGRTPISLSMGVALAQTGPDGTMMLFHVDYEFAVEDANRSPQYVWVVERAHGESVKKPCALERKGNLEAPFPGWPPTTARFMPISRMNAAMRFQLNRVVAIAGFECHWLCQCPGLLAIQHWPSQWHTLRSTHATACPPSSDGNSAAATACPALKHVGNEMVALAIPHAGMAIAPAEHREELMLHHRRVFPVLG